jgi:hypothetical protein
MVDKPLHCRHTDKVSRQFSDFLVPITRLEGKLSDHGRCKRQCSSLLYILQSHANGELGGLRLSVLPLRERVISEAQPVERLDSRRRIAMIPSVNRAALVRPTSKESIEPMDGLSLALALLAWVLIALLSFFIGIIALRALRHVTVLTRWTLRSGLDRSSGGRPASVMTKPRDD